MLTYSLRKKFCIAAIFCFIAFPFPGDVSARDPGPDTGPGRGRSRHEETVMSGPHKYYYRDGRFYRPGLFGLFDTLIAPPPGLVVTVIPETRRIVIINGMTYYYYEDVYYTKCPNGYVVVNAPVTTVTAIKTETPAVIATAAATELDGEPVTVNIPNSDGTYTPVKLFKHRNGYKGPQGEFYEGHPTVEQLKALYGK